MSEKWARCPGFPAYLVSDMGRVRSRTTVSRSGRIMTVDQDNYGYPKVSLAAPGGGRRTVLVHRLVALAFRPNDDPGRKVEVDHLNGDHADARAENLEWVTPEENRRRAAENGLLGRHMTPEQEAYAVSSPKRPSAVAREIGFSVDAVRNARRRHESKEES